LLVPVKVFETFCVCRRREEGHGNRLILRRRRTFRPVWCKGKKISGIIIRFDFSWTFDWSGSCGGSRLVSGVIGLDVVEISKTTGSSDRFVVEVAIHSSVDFHDE
jgi:hypothetical protein